MDRKFKILLITILFTGLFTGCSVANPNVSALTELTSFSNKSTSPFMQDNVGEAIFFSGYCLPQVTGFEFRLNDGTIWSQIPNSAPTPAAGEYLVGTPVYDVDCSDGLFDFYVFKTAAMDNFTLNSSSPGPGDPSKIELRALGVENIPTIVFNRPEAASFQMFNYQNNFYGLVEAGQDYPFTMRLLDTFGHHTMIGSNQSLLMTITTVNLSGPALPAGDIYDGTCTVPITQALTTFLPGDEEIDVCFKATGGINPGDIIRITVSAPGMISYVHDVSVRAQYTAAAFLSGYTTYSLPQTLVKGVDYILNMGMTPIFTNNYTRSISVYSGSLQVTASSNQVSFVRNGGDIDCSSTPVMGTMSCPTTVAQKAFVINVGDNYSGSSISLNIQAIPTPSCGSSCSMYESGNNYPIGDYVSKNHFFNVVSSSKVYFQPIVDLRYGAGGEQVIRLNNCQSAQISLANDEGYALPSTVTTLVTVASTGSYVSFYSSPDCSTYLNTSVSMYFYPGDLTKEVYFRSTTAPGNGIINMTVNDGTNTFNFPFYTKSN